MKIFAADEVRAKSLFWGFMRRLRKVKRSNGQLLSLREVCYCCSRDSFIRFSASFVCCWVFAVSLVFLVHRELDVDVGVSVSGLREEARDAEELWP
jgi:hypothetical protein